MQTLPDLIGFIPSQTAWLLLASLLFLVITLLVHFKLNAPKLVYAGIFISISLAGLGFASIDDFLHPWDEQFHALVARNMMSDPLHPVLIDDMRGNYDYKTWIYNQTWLHKQPLFLWQIALSFKMFGTNLLALRLPSVLLYAATSCMVLSVSKRFFDPFFAILTAVLFGYCSFSLDFISGVQGMDHNDIAFLFYVTASCWSWMKYQETKQVKFAVLTGIFSGGAVLCKWLTGIIVYAGWGAVLLCLDAKNRREWRNILLSFGVCVLVFLPWQLFCLACYPLEYKHELAYNSQHFFNVVENHGGSWLFYFDGMKQIYGGGDLMRLLVIVGFLLTAVAGIRAKNPLKLFSVVVFAIVYAFFMLATTKLHGYVLIVSGFGFIFLLVPFYELFRVIRTRVKPGTLHYAASSLLILLLLTLHFHAKGVIDRHNFRSRKNTELWQDQLSYASSVISKAGTGTKYFLLKNETVPIIPALRFTTGKSIYLYSPELDTGGAMIIDLAKK